MKVYNLKIYFHCESQYPYYTPVKIEGCADLRMRIATKWVGTLEIDPQEIGRL
jgi:hypothetical protein